MLIGTVLAADKPLITLGSSRIVDEIQDFCMAGLEACIAFFYCSFQDSGKQTCLGLLSSLLMQLCSQSYLCHDTLLNAWRTHSLGSRGPTCDALTTCLVEMIKRVVDRGVMYILIDALDECPTGLDSERGYILDVLRRLSQLECTNLRICVTSRPEYDIQIKLQPLASHEVSVHAQSGQQQDIASYVHSVVNTDCTWREQEKKIVIDTLSENADGMYVLYERPFVNHQ